MLCRGRTVFMTCWASQNTEQSTNCAKRPGSPAARLAMRSKAAMCQNRSLWTKLPVYWALPGNICNGDEQQAVPNTQVPVLKKDQVPAWLNKSLDIEDCNKTINAPFPVKRNCFAWQVSTDDMEPEFYRGSYVLLDKSEDYAIKHIHRRLFVLVGIINTSGHFGITDISKFLDHVDSKIPNNTESAPVSYSDMILCELCKTIQGYQLMSANRRFTTALDRKKHQILAQARYSINVY